MNEASRIAKWLTATLKADVTLAGIVGTRVFNGLPPSGTALPYITFNQQASRDVQGNGTHRSMTRPLYQVKGVVKAASMNAQSDQIAERIDEILQNTSAETYDDVILSIRRESEVVYQEVGSDPAQRFFHHGGVYRFDTQAAA